MRLIDADEFKKYVSEMFEQNKDLFQTDEYRNFAGAITQGILDDIDKQPTAYNVDKIVEQLEELKDTERDDGVAELITTMVWNRSISKAIEIVKKGLE